MLPKIFKKEKITEDDKMRIEVHTSDGRVKDEGVYVPEQIWQFDFKATTIKKALLKKKNGMITLEIYTLPDTPATDFITALKELFEGLDG